MKDGEGFIIHPYRVPNKFQLVIVQQVKRLVNSSKRFVLLKIIGIGKDLHIDGHEVNTIDYIHQKEES